MTIFHVVLTFVDEHSNEKKKKIISKPQVSYSVDSMIF